ncbi:MAG TPA: hypothetical protein VF725_12940 [Ktedonobacterales bacterium]|jgi:hypothetical protein
MSLSVTVLIIAAVLSLPGGLFVARLISPARVRFLGLVGGVLGAAITAVGLQYYVLATRTNIDAISWFIGAFLACSMGVAAGALLINFFASAGRAAESGSAE